MAIGRLVCACRCCLGSRAVGKDVGLLSVGSDVSVLVEGTSSLLGLGPSLAGGL